MKTKIYIGDTIYVGCKCAEAVKVADAPQSETDATPTEEQPTETKTPQTAGKTAPARTS